MRAIIYALFVIVPLCACKNKWVMMPKVAHYRYEKEERKMIEFEETKLNPRRKYYVVVKDGFEIFFFNIKRRNFDHFYNLVVNSITVVDDKTNM